MDSCCDSAAACVFSRALLARSAGCALATRRMHGERDVVECPSPVARINCDTLAALLHERARFALKLPRPGQPLIHAQALRLHCGGLAGMQQALEEPVSDVHHLVGVAQQRHGTLAELPWPTIVAAVVAWRPRPRRAG